METPRPSLTTTEAARIAAECFGLDGEARELPAEFDRNFLISAADGRRFVLKVSHGDRPGDELEMQVAALRYLARSEAGGRLPRVVAVESGDRLLRMPFADGREHWVRLLTFVAGDPLVRLHEPSPRLLREIGRFLAELDEALTGFDHPAARRSIPWDLTRLMELADGLALIGDGRRRELVERQLDRFERTVVPRLARLRRSVIHNDANDHNLLVDGLNPATASLCGLIDFGDMIETVTAAEPAIAAAYVMLDDATPWRSAAPVLLAYDSVRPLDSEERAVLPELVLARLCASVLMSARARYREPDNEYLLVSERPVWDLLERWESREWGELVRMAEGG
jgi:Ser/Thr protein kinase RdoA (MazF antagonist)